jgi:hypothetical protein
MQIRNADLKYRLLRVERGRRRHEYDALVRIFAMGNPDGCDGMDHILDRAGSRESGGTSFFGVIECLVEECLVE